MPQAAAYEGKEVEKNLTLFFRPFLNTPEGMAAYLGFKGTP
jgi:hypothetical protein